MWMFTRHFGNAARWIAGCLIFTLIAGCASASPSVLPTSSASFVPTRGASASEKPSPTLAPSTPSPTNAPTPAPSLAGGMSLAAADLSRAAVSPDDAAAAAAAIDAFGMDLYRLLGAGEDDFVFSPASIALALGMARAGARGKTAAEMDAVMHDVASDAHAAWLNALDQALADRNGTFLDGGYNTVPLTLRIANSSFLQQGMPIEQAYLDALASRFGSGERLVDFIGHTEEARQLINGWVDDQTEQRIPELLAQGVLTPLTRLALVNAIYLEAGWFYKFDESLTTDGPFRLRDGSQVEVPMMTTRWALGLGYAAGAGWQAVGLPYTGHQLAMTLILPDDLASFEASLDGGLLAQIVGAVDSHGQDVILTMPKFGVETKADLKDALSTLGMSTAFDPAAADFSGVTSVAALNQLHISDVIHQANIDVDEKGTTAAAATAVPDGIGAASAETPPPPIILNIDHPFIFALHDVPTGAMLFLGRVTDP